MPKKPANTSSESLKIILGRLFVVVVFSGAFAYIEAAVVVYLREIFHSDGFTFPLTTFGLSPLWNRLLLTEVGREAATLVIILTGVWLFGRNLQQRFAFFLTIFAVWDIFYYVWLKVLINWPDSVMDWDILFLIPVAWAGPVLAPVIVSVTLLVFAVIMLTCSCCGRAIKATVTDWLGFVLAALAVVVSFCIAGAHIREPNFQSYFYWPVFAVGEILAIGLFVKCLLKSKKLKTQN